MKTRITILLLLALTGQVTLAQEEEGLFIYDMGQFAVTLLSEGQRTGNSGILIGATPPDAGKIYA